MLRSRPDVFKPAIHMHLCTPYSHPHAHLLSHRSFTGEDKAELDRFCDALITIRAEIAEIEAGKIAD
jgi:glycine cleavage system protein P-like pyridoxal-binding family